MYLKQGLKYTKDGFYMNSNNQDFKEEVMIDTSEVEEVEEVKEGDEDGG